MLNSINITPSIAVIIPSNHAHAELLKIVMAVCRQTVKPAEIIIVDSFVGGELCRADIVDFCWFHGVKLIYEHRKLAFPGQARNIGLGLAKAELIAFIDVQTIPRIDWLETSLKLILKDNVAGVWGGACFSAETCFEKLIRDAFFGRLPRKTLPGSVFVRDVFVKTGQFIDWVRAGEDTDWMLRLELQYVPVVNPAKPNVDYIGIVGLDIKAVMRKWHRNYNAAYHLPHLFPQKLFLWIVLYPMLMFVAFNWNYLIANWRMDSPFYIGHITKMTAILPLLAYILTRGILLPLRRGVGFSNLIPFRFIAVVLIAFMADSIKAYVFSVATLSHFRK